MVSKPFSGKENCICNNDMAAKIEFLHLREDARFRTDLNGEDKGDFGLALKINITFFHKKLRVFHSISFNLLL